MKFPISIIGLSVATVMFVLFNQSVGKHEPVQPTATAAPASDQLPQIIRSVDLEKPFNFANENIPNNFDVKERLDRELLVNSYWHSSTLLHIKAAQRYFPLFDQILSEEEVPLDFKYISVAESSLRNATSGAGARGFWQIMPAVAKAYGLEINSEVDERYHVEKATRAACKLIKKYKNRFGNWTNAAGAYNMGETRFAKEMNRQMANSYYDMNFGEETNRYVFRILAIKEIMQNPSGFGFYLDKEPSLYQPLEYTTVTAEKSIPSLAEFAKSHGTSYRMLKVYNPWLISYKLTISPGNSYDIKIPRNV